MGRIREYGKFNVYKKVAQDYKLSLMAMLVENLDC